MVIGLVSFVVLVCAFLIATGRAFPVVFFFMDFDFWWRGPLKPLTFIFVGIALVMAVIVALGQRGEFASP